MEEVGRLLPGAELAIPSAVRAELDRLVQRGAAHAVLAREFARSLRTVPTTGRGDRAVVEAAVRLRATVVTADRTLGARLRGVGVAVLAPRDRVRLDLKLPTPPAGPRRRARPRPRRPKR